jgi:PAS domain S-box-containing protein
VTSGGILVLSDRATPAGARSGSAGTQLASEVVRDLDTCVARLRQRGSRIALVVVDRGWPRPLSAVRQLRDADASVGVAVAVAADEAEAMRSRLAFLPDAGEVAVVDADVPPEELGTRLLGLSGSAHRRQRVRGALDAMNRDLAVGRPEPSGPARSAVSEHYLAALVRHAADTIVSVDPSRRVVTVNEAGRQAWGLDPEEVEGRAIDELLAADDPGRLHALLAGAEDGPAQVDHELPLRLASGRELLLSATAAAVRDDAGALAGLVIIARDITAERRAEQRLRALQKAESLAALASGVAHDFNNLLVIIQGWTEVAAATPERTELVTGALEHIQVATRQAADLARAMLAYGGRGHIEPQLLRLAALLTDLRPLLAASVPVRIGLYLDVSTDAEVRADPTQLRQVVLNLVGNAAEAIGEGDGTIRLRTGVEDVGVTDLEGEGGVHAQGEPPAPGRYAVVEVTDTGPGIAPDHLGRLFDPFFTTRFTGRGLGLAASLGIARAHGGTIVVRSTPGAGACFRVLLPLDR